MDHEAWLIQQAELSLIERNRLQPFRIFRFRGSHHTIVLKNKVYRKQFVSKLRNRKTDDAAPSCRVMEAITWPRNSFSSWEAERNAETNTKHSAVLKNPS